MLLLKIVVQLNKSRSRQQALTYYARYPGYG